MDISGIDLKAWGYNGYFEALASSYPSLMPARVTEQHRNLYKLVSAEGFFQAQVSGKLAYEAQDNTSFPAVGDWVMIDRGGTSATIHAVLPRKSLFERRAAGTANTSQIVAANIDTVFICMALNEDYSLRRMERYLSIAWDSRATPVILLTKSDLCTGLEKRLAEISSVACGADILVCSSVTEDGYAQVIPHLKEGKTFALIGSSGVGKSTMINARAGAELLHTNAVRDDGKGRHTTTHRQMVLLPGRGVVIDTPGMREIGVESADLSGTFREIEALSHSCRFSDCTHTSEPGCAVLAAVSSGEIDPDRLKSYLKLRNEAGYDGMTSKEIEDAKIKRMFGGKGEMKQALKEIRRKNGRQ